MYVEPLYGSPAVALALDAGWSEVEVRDLEGAAPIPLVSFEQPVPVDQAGGRCRVRCDDFDDATIDAYLELPGVPVLLGSVVNARPLCARLASWLASLGDQPGSVVFVAAESEPLYDDIDKEFLSADAWWASGMLVRVLLDELEGIDATLTDAAGMAVALATGDDDPLAHLGNGLRWRRHLARGGSPDDLRVAAAIDSCGAVPQLVGGHFEQWRPDEGLTPEAGPPADRS